MSVTNYVNSRNYMDEILIGMLKTNRSRKRGATTWEIATDILPYGEVTQWARNRIATLEAEGAIEQIDGKVGYFLTDVGREMAHAQVRISDAAKRQKEKRDAVTIARLRPILEDCIDKEKTRLKKKVSEAKKALARLENMSIPEDADGLESLLSGIKVNPDDVAFYEHHSANNGDYFYRKPVGTTPGKHVSSTLPFI